VSAQRTQQTEYPRDLPPLVPPPGSMQPGQSPDSSPDLARLAGALAALASRVDQIGQRAARPAVTRADRLAAMEKAREWVTDLGVQPGHDRIHAELAVARYLTGE
jgi:hypothetical protein